MSDQAIDDSSPLTAYEKLSPTSQNDLAEVFIDSWKDMPNGSYKFSIVINKTDQGITIEVPQFV